MITDGLNPWLSRPFPV